METEHNEWTTDYPLSDDAVVTLPTEEPQEVGVTEDVTQRLAADFLALAEAYPQFVSPSQLPDEVLDMAAQQNISLLDAYLRHRLQEEKKIAAAAEKRHPVSIFL